MSENYDFDKTRFARHLSLPGFGEKGQLKLKNGSVLIIGAGGLGSPIGLYLAAAGIGRIGIIDGDCVDISNLQRQVIHDTDSLGRKKVDSAFKRMHAINPETEISKYDFFAGRDNLPPLVKEYDFIIDATDSFKAKFMINDVCVEASKPYSHGAIWQYEGQAMTIVPGSACYRCLFDSEPQASSPGGPLGVVPGIMGTIQAAEAIKYISGTGELLTNTLLRFNILTMDFVKLQVNPRRDCICSATNPQKQE